MERDSRTSSSRLVILVGGGSCAGKTTFVSRVSNATVISMDDFYKGKSRMNPPYNFDEPAAIDLDSLIRAIDDLSQGKTVEIPQYDMKLSEPVGTKTMTPQKKIVVEGIFSLYSAQLRKLGDLSIYLDVPVSERVRRRIERDIERGRDSQETLEHSLLVEKEHARWVEPQKKWADIIISG